MPVRSATSVPTWRAQARTEHEIEAMSRDLIASMLDVEPDSFELDIEMPAR